MRVLLTGGKGFIGRQVAVALRLAGHDVVLAVRPGKALSPDTVACDFSCDLHESDWLPHLVGIDALVNCAGILRERGRATYERVHVLAPAALYRACVSAGVKKVVQISALGEPADNEFIASKFRGDAILQSLPLASVILRPSVVYSVDGAYGGTSMLRAMAALPGLLVLPGTGKQLIQPICLDDLAAMVVAALGNDAAVGRILGVGGPEQLGLERYLELWRNWLAGETNPLVVRVPLPMVRLGARVGDLMGQGPLNSTVCGMLEHGNHLEPEQENAADVLGIRPLALADVLASRPAFVQDRWHARLYFLKPALVYLVALVWLLSALAGFMAGPAAHAHFAVSLGMSPAHTRWLVWASSALDAGLGLCLLAGCYRQNVIRLMLLSVLAYTFCFGLLLPSLWLDPLGGLIKNLLVIPALVFLLATGDEA